VSLADLKVHHCPLTKYTNTPFQIHWENKTERKNMKKWEKKHLIKIEQNINTYFKIDIALKHIKTIKKTLRNK
jgi:hypothetical protein